MPPRRQDVVRRAEAGDSQAFRQIFDEHAPAVRRFAHDMLKSEELADEATQETFVRAHTRLNTLHDADKLGSWLLGITRFVSLERLRGLKRERIHDSIDGEDSQLNLQDRSTIAGNLATHCRSRSRTSGCNEAPE